MSFLFNTGMMTHGDTCLSVMNSAVCVELPVTLTFTYRITNKFVGCKTLLITKHTSHHINLDHDIFYFFINEIFNGNAIKVKKTGH